MQKFYLRIRARHPLPRNKFSVRNVICTRSGKLRTLQRKLSRATSRVVKSSSVACPSPTVLCRYQRLCPPTSSEKTCRETHLEQANLIELTKSVVSWPQCLNLHDDSNTMNAMNLWCDFPLGWAYHSIIVIIDGSHGHKIIENSPIYLLYIFLLKLLILILYRLHLRFIYYLNTLYFKILYYIYLHLLSSSLYLLFFLFIHFDY